MIPAWKYRFFPPSCFPPTNIKYDSKGNENNAKKSKSAVLARKKREAEEGKVALIRARCARFISLARGAKMELGCTYLRDPLYYLLIIGFLSSSLIYAPRVAWLFHTRDFRRYETRSGFTQKGIKNSPTSSIRLRLQRHSSLLDKFAFFLLLGGEKSACLTVATLAKRWIWNGEMFIFIRLVRFLVIAAKTSITVLRKFPPRSDENKARGVRVMSHPRWKSFLRGAPLESSTRETVGVETALCDVFRDSFTSKWTYKLHTDEWEERAIVNVWRWSWDVALSVLETSPKRFHIVSIPSAIKSRLLHFATFVDMWIPDYLIRLKLTIFLEIWMTIESNKRI